MGELAVFPAFKSCCFCVSLRLSTILIAFIYTFLSVPLLFVYGTPIFRYGDMEDSTRYFFLIAFLTLIAQFFTGCILIYAAIKKAAWLFPAWVWLSFCQGAVLVLLAMVCTLIYIYEVTKGLIDDTPEDTITYMIYAIYGLVLYFAAAVVNSYRKQLLNAENENEDEQVESLPLRRI